MLQAYPNLNLECYRTHLSLNNIIDSELDGILKYYLVLCCYTIVMPCAFIALPSLEFFTND